jgi:hypothetical protein
VKIPPQLTAGTTVTWDDLPTTDILGNSIDPSTYTLDYYFRFNEVFSAFTSTATPVAGNWRTTLSAATTAPLAAGTWYWSAIATNIATPTTKHELGRGQLTIAPSLTYTGSTKAYDGRTQAEKDLAAVQAAIRTLMQGGSVQEYRIGTRSIKRYDLSELIMLEGRLKAEVKREQTSQLIANGLGNPRNMFVRFN